MEVVLGHSFSKFSLVLSWDLVGKRGEGRDGWLFSWEILKLEEGSDFGLCLVGNCQGSSMSQIC